MGTNSLGINPSLLSLSTNAVTAVDNWGRMRLRKAGRFCQFVQRRLGAGADMADDLGGAQAAERAAGRQLQAARQTEQEAGRVQIAGTGRVGEAIDRHGRDIVRLV